ncbi:PQQ-dependent sugar dehydrogenase [Brevibacillus sp. WF146]|uniref:PQQ-dependent sugar dehydrogenase n=1 Tax=Brevibacillus sp. WF146 TaxID=319501 RepID=UPI0022264DA8|nr:PQQ-dependent sugar dehydrogenase [Brevibacillus sp. WF146]UYZ13011.1 PQQ-dependent sugar dehydrogenase [Brevibacillus sp. WF146]
MKAPILHSGDTTWAPAGMTFVTRGPWQGRLMVANLRGEQILNVALDPGNPSAVQSFSVFYQNKYGRLRDVVEGPDGSLYLLTSNRDGRGDPRPGDDRIIRLGPGR